MTDFSANPEPLKDVTDGDAGERGDGEHTASSGGTGHADLTAIREDMEVVGSDGGHVGEVDHFRDGQLKLKRKDSEALDGQHHYVPADWVTRVDANANRITLNLGKDEATRRWTPAG